MSSPSVTQEAIAGPNMVRRFILICSVAVMAALYFQIFRGLILQWLNDSNFSHGLIVPFFCGWIVWRNRKELAAIPLKPSSFGLVAIILAIVLLTVGNFGAELFSARTLFHFPSRRPCDLSSRMAALSRPALCPLLSVFDGSDPCNHLQPGHSSSSVACRPACGLYAGIAGNPGAAPGKYHPARLHAVEVAEACSGIRSLLSLGTLTVILGYLVEPAVWKRVILVIASIPIAVGANAIRIVGTGLAVQYGDAEKALGFFHEFSGLLIFVFAFGMLMILQKSLQTRKPGEPTESTS